MRRVRVIVRGEVQGVGYRYSLKIEAEEAGVSGWVRNRADGSVEAELEGPDERLEDVVAWMAGGPPGSRVDDATLTDLAPTGESGFQVRRA